ncbi:retrovirus-related Pol polyprotein from transposon 297-like Protein [Nephila pilipes]|uniref:Retrovirus-related Pol polyprotein from transposon 297-like Protein n=1 Tax=Nephila pilipes TaxID=299642 RepID=A0A8X6NM77_NEPPI|nr:retrovirus-related Pol polyprotein from transposon 297-like Protein [Nephila pilipes]
MTENSNAQQHVSRVAAKLPPLWKQNVKLWFLQAEANFELSGITNDVNSENLQIRKVLSELQLGDDKPSHLLRKMKELAGTAINDDFLRNLWLQRLPAEIQTILSVSSEKLENLAKLADKIAEVRASPFTQNVYAVSGRSEQSSDSPHSPLNELCQDLSCRSQARIKRERWRESDSEHRDSTDPTRWEGESLQAPEPVTRKTEKMSRRVDGPAPVSEPLEEQIKGILMRNTSPRWTGPNTQPEHQILIIALVVIKCFALICCPPKKFQVEW